MTERKFKIGDRVRIIGQKRPEWGDCPAQTGDAGTVKLFVFGCKNMPAVDVDGREKHPWGGWGFDESELELIEGGN
uniref:Uncharacterized protein n=1 Tax=viral metagenome TaxID=1070528 RepID=A0A6M3JHM8_9ZZZZ